MCPRTTKPRQAGFFTRLPPSTLPGFPGSKKKYCLCCGITIGASDQPNLNKGWANASWERKQEIIADHTYSHKLRERSEQMLQWNV